MKYTNLHGYKKISQFVNYKLDLLNKNNPTFANLYELMFNEPENVLFESSNGIKITKTTYGEAKQKVELYARNICRLLGDKKRGSLVGIYLDNSDTWIEVFWAILKAGYCPLLLNMRLSNEILEKTIKNADFAPVIGKNIPFNANKIEIEELEKETDFSNVNKEFGEYIFVMSSGTTNNIKLCAYSASEFFNIVKQAKYVISNNSLAKKHYNCELKLLAFLPFYHIFGLVAMYVWFGYFSRTFVSLKDLSPTTIQNTIKRHHITHIFAVPLFWQRTYESALKVIKGRGNKTYNKFLKGMKLASRIGDVPIFGKLFIKLAFKEVRENLFGDSVFFMISGGSHIDSRVMTFFNNIGYHLANGYGMSEIGITSFEISNKNKYLNDCSIGNPLPGVEYKIDENGELLIKSISSASFVIEGEKKRKVNGTWFNSHDLAEYKNGRYYLTGRSDDLVVSITGENLNPNIIEESLYVDGVNGLCLIKNEENQTPTLLVSINRFTKKEKAEMIMSNLKQLIKDNNLDSQIGKIDFVTSPFIKEDEFKPNRKRIEKEYFSGSMSRYLFNDTNEEEDELNKKVKEYFAFALNLKVEDISLDADFFLDNGGTSLDYFAMLNKLQEDFGVSLVSTDDNNLHTVRQVSNYLRERL